MGTYKIKYQEAMNERAKETTKIFRDGSDLTPYIYAVRQLGAVRVLRIRDMEKNGKELDVKLIAEAVKSSTVEQPDHCGFCDFVGTTEEVDAHILAEHPEQADPFPAVPPPVAVPDPAPAPKPKKKAAKKKKSPKKKAAKKK